MATASIPTRKANAIALARKPNLDRLAAAWPHTQLATSGLAVGLPEGQMGNSEVGHMNIGAGKRVLQDFTRVTAAIHDGSFFENPALLHAIAHAKANGGKLHLAGLMGPGGVHAHQEHLYACCGWRPSTTPGGCTSTPSPTGATPRPSAPRSI